MEHTTAQTVVVGVDGTQAGREALRFALDEGAARGAAVEVITVWSWSGPHESLAGPGTAREACERAQATQDEALAAALEQVGRAPVVSRRVVEGDPADVLLRASRAAGLLVVGTEHKGLVKRAFLGSVSERCVRHANVPVVVVPARRAEPSRPAVAVAT